MPRVCYKAKTFTSAHQQIIDQANRICEEYLADGLVLTLRQIYYQFVARGLMANKQTEYDRLDKEPDNPWGARDAEGHGADSAQVTDISLAMKVGTQKREALGG